ncbi:hypothetical protein GWN42_10185 [candidate division KSB1 bacterium]|nr:hypothetical protein [candidate division KSB1 bacterium]
MRLHTIAPVLAVVNVVTAIEWYKTNLDFEAMPFPEQPYVFAILQKEGNRNLLTNGGGVHEVFVQPFTELVGRLYSHQRRNGFVQPDQRCGESDQDAA